MKLGSRFTVGAMALTAAMFAAGCASETPELYTIKLNNFLKEAQGQETHEKQPEKYVLPNVLLENSKVMYIQTGSAVTDAIKLRFGDSDVLLVTQSALDTHNTKAWNSLKNADNADDTNAKKNAENASKELKETIVKAYDKLKTTSKKTPDEIFDTVVGLQAQEDFIAFKHNIKNAKTQADKKVLDEQLKKQKSWLERGAKNVTRVYAEQKIKQAAAEAKLKAAKDEADAANHKVALVVKYWTAKTSAMAAQAAAQKAGNPFVQKASEIAINQAQAIMDSTAKEWPEVKNVFAIPNMNDPLQAVDVIKKELTPYTYSIKVANDRFVYVNKALPWWYDSYQALKEASGD